ncbi:MAG: DegT/DnrJ/EryC1/StrS family aminotransferase [Acidobacteria bacterium]|nr:MAG: DegT/DnrJ/EryC1/StrS family aminotransferase [Acidobacteriota bacterium]
MGTVNRVPFLDLSGLHAEIEEDLVAVFRRALKTSGFVGGPEVEQFENEFAQFCDVDLCVGVNSGTDALRFALIAAGVGQGDAVITVPNTFIATAEAISQSGAVPRFVDVDPKTYNMDAGRLEDYLANKSFVDRTSGRLFDLATGNVVKAIVPVHLYGQPVDMDPILELAESYNLIVIEDACQAHGAQYFSRKMNQWRRVGSMGLAAAFSFYPGKNLGACGEGGAVTTNDPEVARKVRMLRDHGQPRKYYHDMEGYNGRLHSIQAGFLRTKLGLLSDWNEKRREAANRYREFFGAVEAIVVPYEPEWANAVYHLFVVRVPERADAIDHLSRAGVGTGIHYPIPLHLQKAYNRLGYKAGDFPVAEKAAAEILSLPMFPGITVEQQKLVAAELQQFISKLSGDEAREAAA